MSLALGTAALGRPQYINVREEGFKSINLEAFKKQGFEVLEEAYKLGIRYFDTAPGYGLSERLLLEWLQTKNDSKIELATKWGYTYVANFDPNAKIHEVKEHSLKKLKEQWEVSKAFLPYLKVYQIHSATLETGVLSNEEVLNELAYLKAKHDLEIGITVTGTNQLEVIKKALEVSIGGKQLFDAFQVTYNILDQSLATISDELVQQDKRIIIKEALANGRLLKNKNFPNYSALYENLEQLARKYKTGIDAIALKFCELSIPNSTVLSGVSNISHLQSNFKMHSFSLKEEEILNLKNFAISTEDYWQERKKLIWN